MFLVTTAKSGPGTSTSITANARNSRTYSTAIFVAILASSTAMGYLYHTQLTSGCATGMSKRTEVTRTPTWRARFTTGQDSNSGAVVGIEDTFGNRQVFHGAISKDHPYLMVVQIY